MTVTSNVAETPLPVKLFAGNAVYVLPAAGILIACVRYAVSVPPVSAVNVHASDTPFGARAFFCNTTLPSLVHAALK